MDLNFGTTEFTKVSEITIPDVFYNRLKCGIPKIDELFNNGILPGSTHTLSGAAGSGKSSLLLQVAEGLKNNGHKVGYTTGEESVYQLAYTAGRLGCKNVPVANIVQLDRLLCQIKILDCLIIDSFQCIKTKEEHNNLQRERYAIQEIVKTAQQHECAVIIIVHHTKAGNMKGSSIIPHTVDGNLNIISTGSDRRSVYFTKHRFGPLNSVDAILAPGGYDFNVVAPESEPVVPGVYVTDGKKQIYKEILALPETITMESVCESQGINIVKAGTILRDLVKMGKLTKIGRGDDAHWILAKLDETD